MKIGLFTEFSYPGKSEQQAYAEVLEQIAVADDLATTSFRSRKATAKIYFPARLFLWDSTLPRLSKRAGFVS